MRYLSISKNQLEYYVHCKRTVKDIIKLTGKSYWTVDNAFKQYNIDPYHECIYCGESDLSELRVQWRLGQFIIFDICDDCDRKNKKQIITKVNKVEMQRHRFETLSRNTDALIPDKGYLSRDVFYHEYVVNKKSLYQLKDEWDCCERTILKYLALYGFTEKYFCENCGTKKNLFPKKEKGMFKYRRLCKKCTSSSYSKAQISRQNFLDKDNKFSKELIIDLHYNQKMSMNKICKHLKIGMKKVRSLFRKYNIKEIKCCEKCGSTSNMHKSHSPKGKAITFNFCEKCFSKMTNYRKESYSKVSQELFWSIHRGLSDKYKKECYFAELNGEYADIVEPYYRENFDVKNYKYRYDFTIIHRGFKFVIEFNGDMFHANPQIFGEDDRPFPFDRTLTSRQIWDKDDKKENYIHSTGGYVLVIWECDYNRFKDKCVSFCLKRIESTLKNIPRDFRKQLNEMNY